MIDHKILTSVHILRTVIEKLNPGFNTLIFSAYNDMNIKKVIIIKYNTFFNIFLGLKISRHYRLQLGMVSNALDP